MEGEQKEGEKSEKKESKHMMAQIENDPSFNILNQNQFRAFGDVQYQLAPQLPQAALLQQNQLYQQQVLG